MRESLGKTRLLCIVLVVLLLAAVGLYFVRAEKQEPGLSIEPERSHITNETKISFGAQDDASGLAEVKVLVRQKDIEKVIVEQELDPETAKWQDSLTLEGQGFQDGSLEILVQARDRSWTNFFQGNQSELAREFELDNSPPGISLQTFVHNLNQGGSGVVGFSLSEPVQKAGVEIDDVFFPAYEQRTNQYLCFFSFPFFIEPGQARPILMAKDKAGNVQRTGFNHHVNSRRFPSSEINVSDNFIQNTIIQFQDLYPEAEDELELFLWVNRDLREENRDKLMEISRNTAARPLWSGRFLRKPNSSHMAGFAEERTYYYQGQEIDEQTHMGIDLASVSRAEVPAANAGRIVFAGRLGIYGQIVIVDHGLGLQSMYAHLSQIDVQEGDQVERGEIVGRTGTTGLAAGDHLHFEILISGISVNPVEWWDSSWIANNITSKLNINQD